MTAQASIRSYLNQAYLLGLLMVAVGLTLSPFLMGMSQFWLVLVWLVDALTPPFKGVGGIKTKLSRFFQNKAAVLLVAFYLMHVLGLLWTSDFQYAMKDLRVKLPILVMPFVLSSMEPLDRKRFDLVMLVYVLSVFIATQFSFFRYIRHDYEDVREISRFISHIRFCLNIVFSMAVVGYYIFKSSANRKKQGHEPSVPAFGMKVVIDRFLQWFLLLWFAYAIFIIESLSGYVILMVVAVVSAVYAFLQWKKSKAWHIGVGAAALSAVVIGVVVIVHFVKPKLKVEPVDFAALEKTTAQGNPYWHDTVYNPVDDGKFVGLYYCKKELQEAWPQRSSMPFDGLTTNDESLEATLARYLTSKDLRKDAQGVMALTDEDIHNIEQGVANYNNWKHPGLHARLSSTLFEYNLYRRKRSFDSEPIISIWPSRWLSGWWAWHFSYLCCSILGWRRSEITPICIWCSFVSCCFRCFLKTLWKPKQVPRCLPFSFHCCCLQDLRLRVLVTRPKAPRPTSNNTVVYFWAVTY